MQEDLGCDGQILAILNQNAQSKYEEQSDHFKKMVKIDTKFLALLIQLVDMKIDQSYSNK